ncbi:cytochrome c oxidase subunit II [Streptomyces sp. DSM 40750]|uniref:cytochrome c oxidase subunit II n=1 Tax=Streptomyces sp. DSM 40750 TaxID=2801030 RepID=UPI00214C42FC|nr:hypothetical protein [Streptomyces sp. DSM 40750]UUU20153.1 hypothetical protein JIX55_07455 [Streptomyces sp. DSM 40750]
MGAGCTWRDFPRLGMPTPVTEEAPRILSLWQGSWAAALTVGALVWGLILWAAIFHRRSRTRTEVPAQSRYNMPIEVLYTVVPLIIVSVLFYFTARDEAELMKQDVFPGHNVNVFEVTPTQEGTFRGKCAELCGVDHARMLFNVKVVSPQRYQEHLRGLADKGQRGFIPAGIEITEPARNNEPRKL